MTETITETLKHLSLFQLLFVVGSPICAIFVIRWVVKFNKYKNEYSKKLKELEAQKCDGPHKWIYMPVESGGDVVNVCERCCWCPPHEAYIKRYFVNAELEHAKFLKELEKYTQEKLEELEVSQELYDKIINIKKDFAIKHLDEKVKEIKENE